MKKRFAGMAAAALLAAASHSSAATIFSESMGNSGATVTIAAHEAANGFDNDSFTMGDGGAATPGDIRISSASTGYAGASGTSNVFLTTTAAASRGFSISGINTVGYTGLQMTFAVRKETGAGTAFTNLALEYSTAGVGGPWTPITVTGLPTSANGTGWYLLSPISIPVAAEGQSNLSFRWIKTDALSGRIDDIVLTGTETPEVNVKVDGGDIASGGSFNFGSFVQAVGTETRTVTIENNGLATLTIGASGVTITNGPIFSTTGAPAPAATIAASSTTTFDIVFDKNQPANTYNSVLTIHSDDVNETAYAINLSASTTAAASPDPEVRDGVTPILDGTGTYSFAAVTVGDAAPSKTFTLHNTGTADLTSISLVAPVGFSITEGLSATIPSGGSDDFTLAVTSTAAPATPSGNVTITSNATAPEDTYTFAIDATVNAGAAPTVVAVVPGATADTVTVRFNKAMSTTGTYVANPGAIAPTGVSASGNEVTLTFSPALPAAPFPVPYTIGATGALATDFGSFTGSTSTFLPGTTDRADLRASVDSSGLSTIEGAGGNELDGTIVRVNGIVLEDVFDIFGGRQVTLAGSPGIVLRSFTGNNIVTPLSPGDNVDAVGAVSSTISGGNSTGLMTLAQTSAAAPFILATNSTGNALPAATELATTDSADFATNDPLESTFVRLNSVAWVSGPGANFPTQAAGAGVDYTVAASGAAPTLTLRIDRDVSNLVGAEGFDGKAAPTGRFDVVGIMGQFDNSNPHIENYQLLPVGYSAIITARNLAVLEGASPLTNGVSTVTIPTATEGGTANSATITLNNTGAATLNMGTVSATGGFNVTQPAATVAHTSGTTSFTVTLPTTAPGTFNGVVTIPSDDQANPSFTFNVTGDITPISSVRDWSIQN